LVQKLHQNLLDTLVALTSTSKYFQMLPAPWSFAKYSQVLQEHSQMLLKAPAVMEMHLGYYEI